MFDLAPYLKFTFDIDVSQTTPEIVFTDKSIYPAGVDIKGFLSITQPDGITVASDIAGTPDITSASLTAKISYRLASDGSIQNGDYILIYTVIANGFDNTVITRQFSVDYSKPNLSIRQHIDEFTPFVFTEDKTDYDLVKWQAANIARSWNGRINTPFTTGVTLSGFEKLFNLIYKGNYYDAQYDVTLTSIVKYQSLENTFVGIIDKLNTVRNVNVYAPLSIPFLINAIFNLFRCDDDCNCQSGCSQNNELLYKAIALLYQLNKDSIAGNVEGLRQSQFEIEKILFPKTERNHTSRIIDAFNFRYVKRVNFKNPDLNGNVKLDLDLSESGEILLSGSDSKINLQDFIFNLIQNNVGFALPNDTVSATLPEYRLFINNNTSPSVYTNYKDVNGNSISVPANSMGLLIYTGGGWSSLVYIINKNTIGLGNVDNTSDINKPLSNAANTAINALQTQLTTINNTLNSIGNITAILGAVNTHADLLALNISALGIVNGDSYIVLHDENKDNAASVYVYNNGWVWVGEWDTSASFNVAQNLNNPNTTDVPSTQAVSDALNFILEMLFSVANPSLSASSNSVTATITGIPSQISSVKFAINDNANSSQTVTVNNGTATCTFTGLNPSTLYTVTVNYIANLNGQTLTSGVLGSANITTQANSNPAPSCGWLNDLGVVSFTPQPMNGLVEVAVDGSGNISVGNPTIESITAFATPDAGSGGAISVQLIPVSETLNWAGTLTPIPQGKTYNCYVQVNYAGTNQSCNSTPKQITM